MYKTLSVSLICAVLSGCGSLSSLTSPKAAEPSLTPMPRPELAAPPPPPGASTAEALDTTTPEQRAAATATPAPATEASLGAVVVALGNPTEAGFWLRSSLVKEAAPGMVKTAGGATVQVDLLPGTGGALLSLAAYRALGLGLTDLPEVTVYGR